MFSDVNLYRIHKVYYFFLIFNIIVILMMTILLQTLRSRQGLQHMKVIYMVIVLN